VPPTSLSPIAKKLLVKPGMRLALVNPPDGYAPLLDPLPDGALLVDAAAGAELDFVQVFARSAEELDRHFEQARAAVKPDGLLWVCYPKGSSRVKTDLNRDILWKKIGEATDLDGVSLVSIDDTWSAMRFRPRDRVGS
jgi:hypothetical protein